MLFLSSFLKDISPWQFIGKNGLKPTQFIFYTAPKINTEVSGIFRHLYIFMKSILWLEIWS